jgi:hypothetical protein
VRKRVDVCEMMAFAGTTVEIAVPELKHGVPIVVETPLFVQQWVEPIR